MEELVLQAGEKSPAFFVRTDFSTGKDWTIIAKSSTVSERTNLMNKFVPFVRWLWSKKDVEHEFLVTVLESSNTDPSVPSPRLTHLESMDLFRLLEKRELVSPGYSGGYLINKTESYKWENFIMELWIPNWLHHWWVRLLGVILLSISSGFFGGYLKSMGEKASDLTVDKFKERTAQVSTQLTQSKANADNPDPKQDQGKGLAVEEKSVVQPFKLSFEPPTVSTTAPKN